MADVKLKRHDTYPGITAILEEENPSTKVMEPVRSLGAARKITFIMASTEGTVLVEGEMTVLNEASGEVGYVWGTEDTSVAGIYRCEVEIEWEAGQIQSIPNSGYRELLIEPDLPNA